MTKFVDILSFSLPSDVVGSTPDLDRAADYLELAAFFARDGRTLSSKLADSVLDEPKQNNDEGNPESQELSEGDRLSAETQSDKDELVPLAIEQIANRRKVLGLAYPFHIEEDGDTIRFDLTDDSLGQVAYMLCLILSDLSARPPVLGFELLPDEATKRKLRQYFQFFATAALAAEINGSAWSFGFPRPDHSGFIGKLKEIWKVINDGDVEPQEGASLYAKDDKVDVFAARIPGDEMPGFLFAAAQVTTGRDMDDRSLRSHLRVFMDRWFRARPVTVMIPYMIVPFVFSREKFVDHVRVVGNLLHRLRIPIRVSEAKHLVQFGVDIEGYSCLASASQWLRDYRSEALRRKVS